MERHKRFGTLAVVSSIVLTVASFAFSDTVCYSSDVSFASVLLFCLRMNLPSELQFSDATYIYTKYLLLACSVIFAIGFLWFKAVLPVPGRRAALAEQVPSAAPTEHDA